MEKRFSSASNPASTLRRSLAYLRFNKVKTSFVIIIAFINVVLTLLGTSLLKPVIDDLVQPTIDGLMSIKEMTRSLTFLSLGLIGLYLISFVLGIIEMRMMITISQRAVRKMREDLFNKLQRLPVSYFDSTRHGDIMSRFTNDLDLVNEMFTTSILEILTSGILLTGIVAMLFYTNWLLAIIALALFPVIILLVKIFTKKGRKGFDGTQKALGDLNGFIEEILSGQKVVKVFNKEEKVKEDFAKINETLSKSSYKASYYSSISIPLVNNLSSFIFIICTLVGALFAFEAKISWLSLSVGTLSVFVAFVRQLNRPLNRSTNQLNIIQAALAGAERMFSIIDLPDEPALTMNKWRAKLNKDGQYIWTDGVEERPMLGEVRFENISFSYVPGQLILNDISLYANHGQKIAFVGSTGAGKTTITNLLTRFYDIDEGKIYIDGIDLKEINRKSMRKSMSLVLQDTHLFSGTIMDNIRYGRLKATRQECIEASKLAQADDFIVKLKEGYDTLISGGNASLSQGQKQLLSIARAAVANPPILILDEATSSIDTRTERQIEKAMDKLMDGRTVLVIAHRLSTIRHSDAIMVLEHGKILERGTHESLLAQKGHYYSLYTGKFELN